MTYSYFVLFYVLFYILHLWYALDYTVVIVSENLSMVGGANTVKSWLGTQWQNGSISWGHSQFEVRNAMSFYLRLIQLSCLFRDTKEFKQTSPWLSSAPKPNTYQCYICTQVTKVLVVNSNGLKCVLLMKMYYSKCCQWQRNQVITSIKDNQVNWIASGLIVTKL